MITRREVQRAHRAIDLLRPIVNGQRRYQVVCLCGRKSVVGSRALAETDQKNHRFAVRTGTTE